MKGQKVEIDDRTIVNHKTKGVGRAECRMGAKRMYEVPATKRRGKDGQQCFQFLERSGLKNERRLKERTDTAKRLSPGR